MEYNKIDLNNIPDFIPYQQYALSKEEFIEMYNDGEFPNAEVPYDEGPSAGTGPATDGEEDISAKEKKVDDTVEEFINAGAVFRKRAGHDQTINPFETGKKEMDDAAMAGWFLFQIGIQDWTSVDAVGTIDDLLRNDKLINVIEDAKTTSSDSETMKVAYLSQAVKGDLLFFDTYRRDSMVGIYVGDGDVITLDDNGINKHQMWNYIDYEYTYTSYFDWFNGKMRRAPEYNTEGYLWLQNT